MNWLLREFFPPPANAKKPRANRLTPSSLVRWLGPSGNQLKFSPCVPSPNSSVLSSLNPRHLYGGGLDGCVRAGVRVVCVAWCWVPAVANESWLVVGWWLVTSSRRVGQDGHGRDGAQYTVC